MAKNDPTLSFTDIVLRAEAETIRQAYEARVKIDELLAERAKAYEQIAQLEEQVDDVLGDAGVFPFPPPPIPVAGFGAKAGAAARPKPKKPVAKPAPKPSPEPIVRAEDSAEGEGESNDSDR